MFFEYNFFPTASRGQRVVSKVAAGQEESNGGVFNDRSRSVKKLYENNCFERHFIREYSRIFEQNRTFFQCFHELHNMDQKNDTFTISRTHQNCRNST